MMDYERKETGNNGKFKVDDDDEFCISKTVACHSLMQNKARNNFQVIQNGYLRMKLFCLLKYFLQNASMMKSHFHTIFR